MDTEREMKLKVIADFLLEEGVVFHETKARLLLERLEEVGMAEMLEYVERERQREFAL